MRRKRNLRAATVSILFWAAMLMSACRAEPQILKDGETLPELPYIHELDDALDSILPKSQMEAELGISAAVLLPGYKTWKGVSGFSQPGSPISDGMMFDAGSIAKTFEAALALKLAQEGALDLDRPIRDWLAEYPNVDRRITLRQLLNHTSGIFNVFEHPEFPWVDPNVDFARTWSTREVFSNFVLEPYGTPGTVQHYSSTNYRLVTEILEIAGGTAVSIQIESHFLEPLNLRHTIMLEEGAPPEQWIVAHPWVDLDQDGKLEDLYGIPVTWKASLTHPVLYTTAEDLARSMHALFYLRSVLSQSSLEEMLTIPNVADPDPDGTAYGLGIVDFTDVLGMSAFGHGGSALGYSAAALYLPEYNAAVAWLVNTGESPVGLASEIMWNTWSALSEVLLRHAQPAL